MLLAADGTSHRATVASRAGNAREKACHHLAPEVGPHVRLASDEASRAPEGWRAEEERDGGHVHAAGLGRAQGETAGGMP